jgi:protein-S-isoprenylcysteine O-methyltransferase Ste14
MNALRTFAWIVCCIYATIPLFWFLVHPFAPRWRKWRSPYRVLLPLWIAMWVVAAAITHSWANILLYRTPLAWIAGAPLIMAGICLYVASRHGFTSAQLGGRPEIESQKYQQRLVITGIRKRVRHPIYLGHFCEMLGWSIGTGGLAMFALTAFAVITGAVMIRLEEHELEARFGDAYRNYCGSVPAILPKL